MPAKSPSTTNSMTVATYYKFATVYLTPWADALVVGTWVVDIGPIINLVPTAA
jgi:hypothetical protein